MRSRPLLQIVLVVTAAGLVLTACAGAPAAEKAAVSGDNYPVQAKSCGHTSAVAAKPKRAVTLNQGATEVALALGVESQLAGTAYLDDAVPAKWNSAYGSVKVLAKEYPDQESFLAAKPDFAYASYGSAFDAKVVGTQAELAKSGVATYISPFGCGKDHLNADASFDSVWAEVHAVADIFGVSKRATAIETDQKKTLARLNASADGDGLRVFWFDSGDKSAFAGAGEGGPQLILDAVGAENVFAKLNGGWADVSWEKVIKTDPDVIVFADANWSTVAAKKAYLAKDPVLSQLRAVKAKAYVEIPFSESTPGVRLVDGAITVADQLAALDMSK